MIGLLRNFENFSCM